MFQFDLQMIIFSELASIDIAKLTSSHRVIDNEGKATEAITLSAGAVWSYIVSIAIVVILLLELNKTFDLMRKNTDAFNKFIEDKIEKNQKTDVEVELEIKEIELENLSKSHSN